MQVKNGKFVSAMPIKDIKIGSRIRREIAGIESLGKSIETIGLLHPVVLRPDGRLVSGLRRIKAFEALGREAIPAIKVTGFEETARLLRAECDENVQRLPFTPSEAVAMAAKLRPITEAEAKERQREAGKRGIEGGRGKRKTLSKSLAKGSVDPHAKRTDARIAKVVEMSAPTLAKAEAIVQSGDAELITEMDRTRRVNGVFKKLVTKQRRKAKKCKPPDGTYDVIIVDPPWPMEKIEREVAPNQVGFDYATMTVEEILAMKLPCADECHVWLWTTHKFLPLAFGILEGWKLKYVCTFVWHKPGGFQPFGLPQYNCEFALYARRGCPEFVTTKSFPTCFEAPRGAHSEKPDAFYEIVRRVTDGRRLDMFNRRKINGFDGWGDESANARMGKK